MSAGATKRRTVASDAVTAMKFFELWNLFSKIPRVSLPRLSYIRIASTLLCEI